MNYFMDITNPLVNAALLHSLHFTLRHAEFGRHLPNSQLSTSLHDRETLNITAEKILTGRASIQFIAF